MLAAIGAGASASGDSATHAQPARAHALAYAQEDADGTRHDAVSVTNGGSRTLGQTELDTTTVQASTGGGHGSATAHADVEKVTIFDGLVTADSVDVTASADADGTSTSGSVAGLVINGKAVPSPAGRTVYDLGGYGSLVALGSGPSGILGIKAKLTKPYGSHEAGEVVRVAYASATAHDAVAAATNKSAVEHAATNAKRAKRSDGHRALGRMPSDPMQAMLWERRKLARKVSKPDRALAKKLRTLRGYAFPVAGKHNFTDTFGAARSDVPVHVGNDVFAAFGTPIVAVADGRLYRVGTLPISGNRLWLRDRHGYRYFYCHLSDFAASAYNGADVHAGEVIGFVGNTGDAEPTPPHLHFEVHMPDDQVVDPFPYLTKWDTSGISSASWLRRYGQDPGVRPGALVVVKDFLAEP
jgi:murein DD-endopeptidase MepM/ murein hydrolase activator NlpD